VRNNYTMGKFYATDVMYTTTKSTLYGDGFEVVITWIGLGLSVAEPHEFQFVLFVLFILYAL